MSLHTLTITESHKGLQEKEFSCTELTQSCLDAISAHDGAVHAYVTVLEESALAQAKLVDEKIHRGIPLKPLEGIPVALKDNLMTAGIPTTASSKILADYRAPYDAAVVEKLKKEGAVFLGKTNLDEFAMGTSTENSAFGPTKNPWDTARVAGGSSGGSAAAVAANLCCYSIGSDTGGSIRLPAGFCGVAGLKPTYGAVSRYGLIAMASSFDQIGTFGKTVQDAALAFDAIRGADGRDSSSAKGDGAPTAPALKKDIKGLRIGVPKEFFSAGMDADVEKAVRASIETFKDLGCEIVDIELPTTPHALAAYYIIQPAEVSANMARFDGIRYGYSDPAAKTLMETYCRSRGQGLGSEVRRRIMLGTYVLAAGYYDAYYKKAQAVRQLMVQEFAHAFRSVDCILGPTAPTPAFRIGQNSDNPLQMYLMDVFTVSANIAGIPGISVPCGFAMRDGKKLPIGLQLMARHFDESTLLRVTHHYERAAGWYAQKASL